MYHLVSKARSASEQKYACPPRRFAAHMRFLRSGKYNLVRLDDIARYMRNGEEFPAKTVAVTIDDGLIDTHENAFPILQEFSIPTTVFLVAGLVDGANTWMETRDLPSREMLKWSQVREMQSKGVVFGSHTMTHPRLPDLSHHDAKQEIFDSKKVLEDRLGSPVEYFAYPYGLCTERDRDFVQDAGYTLACSARSGFNLRETDPLFLRRIDVYGTDPVWKVAQKMSFGINDASLFTPARYYWRRLLSRLP